jgi:hypothetical protein
MLAQIQEWLNQRALPPGILAVGGCRRGGDVYLQTFNPQFPPEGLENFFRLFLSGQAGPGGDRMAPVWSTWVFERGVIRIIERPDGWLLGIIVAPESPVQGVLDAVAREFLALEPGQ